MSPPVSILLLLALPLRSSSKASLSVAEKLKMVVVALDFEELSSVCARSPPSQSLSLKPPSKRMMKQNI
jgi:hypothetical protein